MRNQIIGVEFLFIGDFAKAKIFQFWEILAKVQKDCRSNKWSENFA